MADKSPELYNLNKTTIVFAAASIILLASLVGMVLQDSTRDWKSFQKNFMEYSRKRAEDERQVLQKQLNQSMINELTAQLRAAEEDEKAHQKEIQNLEKEIRRLNVEIKKSRTVYQDLKQVQDSDRYYFEESRAKGHAYDTRKYDGRLNRRQPELDNAKVRLDDLEAGLEAKKAELGQFTEKQKKTKKDIDKVTQDISRLTKKIDSLKPNLVKAILNAPMLDFLKPTLQIQQVVLDDIDDDFYFAKSKKVDRCITCHLAIDQKGFEKAPQPYRTHPKLDLFLGSNSSHPLESFGCTTCHGGSGHSVNFSTAAHTPRDEKQAEEWRKKYDWHELHHWGEKMLPLNYVEASCFKCHKGVSDVPQAPKLNEGRHLVETSGCLGCHKVAGMERWKIGPSLLNVQSKLEQDWIVRWLHNPKDFRPSTKMPRVFHLSNTSDPENVEKNNATIAAIAAYLVRNSGQVKLDKVPGKGNPETGKKLIEEVGCLGCHTAVGKAANDHGPELSGLGSKVSGDWLYTWIKNPKHYSPGTRMPNLRLSDEQAADITEYLLSQHNEKFDTIRPPHIKPETVQALALTFLMGKMRQKDAAIELKKMNEEQQLLFVGEKSIAHQGCFACHDIKGFEAFKPIGTELTEEGSKDVAKLDFGFIELPHNRQAWFTQKLKEPRIFDRDKVKTYHEKLRMPQFDFTDEQAEALTTFLLSQQKVQIPLKKQKQLNLKEEQIETGRLMATKFNCQGCHTLDGKEGRVREIFAEKGNAPPIIEGEGKKVQAQWLFKFLHAPTTIRPWLKYRMPTFEFTDEEVETLIEYFQNISDAKPAFKGAQIDIDTNSEKFLSGKKLFTMFQCIKCHKSNPAPGLTASFLAPDLLLSKHRLRPEWVVDWLKDPQSLLPGTMMPTFFSEGQSPAPDILSGDVHQQSEALRDYIWEFTPEEAQTVMTAKPAATQK